MNALPDYNFRVWFWVMLNYYSMPGVQVVFGDLGPAEGCKTLRKIRTKIVDRDLPAFRAAYVSAVAKGMSPTVFADVPDNYLHFRFDSRITRFERDLAPFLQPRAIEMGTLAKQWVDAHGYQGRRLGYNRSGVSYWGSQPAMIDLVCATPNVDGLLKGWQQ